MRTQAFYTPAFLDRAITLKERHNLTWAVVAHRLGVPKTSLEVMVSRYRRGDLTFIGLRQMAEREKIERLVEQGLSSREIAARMGSKQNAICTRLKGMGLDPEMRAEIAREFQHQRIAA